MSYDVSIGEFDANYTSNAGKLYHKHINGHNEEYTGLQSLHGKTGKEAFPVLSRAFDSIREEYNTTNNVVAFRAEYDAPNGWGSTDGALIFLARFMAACAANPRKKIHVCA